MPDATDASTVTDAVVGAPSQPLSPPLAVSVPWTDRVFGVAVPAHWSIVRRILFRFFVVYWMLRIAPWNWISDIPLSGYLIQLPAMLSRNAVLWANDKFFHVREKLIFPNGSGDTSFSYAEFQLYLWVALIACVIWSVLDRKRTAYPRADFWLRTVVRYYIATFALSYGIIKIFSLQMVFPGPSQLSTPLGDLLPMRLSWLFIGYSDPYQMFSGVMETVAGVLLLNRRTVTIGLFAAAGAFLNVVMINLSYDVPVKLFASHLFVACVFLLMYDARRLCTFFVLNRAAPRNEAYEPYNRDPVHQSARIAVKAFLVYGILLDPFMSSYQRYQTIHNAPAPRPLGIGLFDVTRYVVKGVELAPIVSDTLRWKDVAFDGPAGGSVGSTDPLFWQRYRRGYFRFKMDSTKHTMAFWKSSWTQDSTHLFTARYEMPTNDTLKLWTTVNGDSLHVEMVRSKRHFQLAERQFHWLSEYNR